MIANVWRHIRLIERQLGLPVTPHRRDSCKDEDYFDAQEYYLYLIEELCIRGGQEDEL